MNATPACETLHAGPVLAEDIVVGHEGQVRWAIVRVTKGLGGRRFQPPAAAVRITQDGCRYLPHVATAQVGQPVEILNLDPLLHVVHGMPFFGKGLRTGEVATLDFRAPEIARLRCDIHPWMSAWIGVFDHPFAAVTDEEGLYRIAGLAPGLYEITAWHERMKPEAVEVVVTEAELSLDFLLQRT